MTKEIIENDPYKLAGVDIDAGNNLIDKIKKSVAASHNKNVLNNIGGFAGMYELDKDIDNPVLVACTDGVGTKLKIAIEKNLLSIGICLIIRSFSMFFTIFPTCMPKPNKTENIYIIFWDR